MLHFILISEDAVMSCDKLPGMRSHVVAVEISRWLNQTTDRISLRKHGEDTSGVLYICDALYFNRIYYLRNLRVLLTDLCIDKWRAES